MRSLLLLLVIALGGCDIQPIERDPPPSPEPPPLDALDAQLRARGREVAGWMMPNGAPMRGELAEGGAREFSHLFQPGWCYKIVGVGAEGVSDLDLRVFDGNDALVQRDTTHDALPIIGMERPICPSIAASYRIAVSVRRGAGEFAVQVHRSL